MAEDLPESSFWQRVAPFGLKLVSYRTWLLGVVVLSVIPYVQQRLIDVGVEWGWDGFRGPRMLDGAWNLVAAHPAPSVVTGAALWLIVAGAFSERHVLLAAHRPTSKKRADVTPSGAS